MNGVKCGLNDIVAAGSIVTKDVPKIAAVGGDHSRVISNCREGCWKEGPSRLHLMSELLLCRVEERL